MINDILLVDDDKDIVNSIGRVLKFKGYEIRTALNAAEALKLAEEREPGLLLADLVMPGRSGIELARDLRRMYSGLPVVFMTGFSDMLQYAKAEGAAALLTKPVDLEDLFAIIDRF